MPDLAEVLDVPQVAERLHLSRYEVYRLIRSGTLDSHRHAGKILVPRDAVARLELAPRPAGRPFSATVSWALLTLLALHQHPDEVSDTTDELSSSRHWQICRYLQETEADELAGRLRRRARRRAYFAHPSLRHELLADRRFAPAGISALARVHADLVAGRDAPAEGYISTADLDAVVEAYGLLDDAPTTNVIVHVVDDLELVPTFLDDRTATTPVVALDLIESGDPRTVEAGLELWHHTVGTYRRGRADA
jgi:excisionase family DNA binding protein